MLRRIPRVISGVSRLYTHLLRPTKRSLPSAAVSTFVKPLPNKSPHLLTAAAIGGASAALYNIIERKTEDNPVSPLRMFYAKFIKDEQAKRNLGIIPENLYKAADNAFVKNKPELACIWLEKMLSVHPNFEEIPLYKAAAEKLFANNHLRSAAQCWEYSSNRNELPFIMVRIGNQFLVNDDVDSAVEYWKKGLDETQMLPYLKKAGDKALELKDIKKAVGYWQQCTTGNELAGLLEKAGNTSRDLKKMEEAVSYWEQAQEKGLKSPAISAQLAHYQMTNKKTGINTALQILQQAVKENPQDSFLLNELGVVWYMSSIKSENFDQDRSQAILCFEAALQLNSNDEIAQKNLEIVKTLTNKPFFGNPHNHLNAIPNQATFMFNPILKELEANREETIIEIINLPMWNTVYDDKGNPTGSRMDLVPTVMPRFETREENVTAIKDMMTLKAHWDEQELYKKTVITEQSNTMSQ